MTPYLALRIQIARRPKAKPHVCKFIWTHGLPLELNDRHYCSCGKLGYLDLEIQAMGAGRRQLRGLWEAHVDEGHTYKPGKPLCSGCGVHRY